MKESFLNFIDLAGSEKVSNHQNYSDFVSKNSNGYSTNFQISNSIQERVKEGKHINKSLFFLTQVISLKSEGK